MKETQCGCPPDAEDPDLRPAEGQEADRELAELSKALGHSARIQILRLLSRRGECHCGEIVEEIPLAQSTVSQHLKILKQAGLIRGQIEGPKVCYCVAPRTLRRFKVLSAAL